ncbi:hypothetical protein [Myxacorys almedinensis]|uniref:Uncharacterized protein n=1 Tax=Myxacorys almedinensis A TaxID=2690445 RepID=A0A8J8CIU0_9CYAN|nr:hypothetical protein [Myxacorys almedinensis]NDJ16896.1 hypothetical protein [Myxacorys almedinensis A]
MNPSSGAIRTIPLLIALAGASNRALIVDRTEMNSDRIFANPVPLSIALFCRSHWSKQRSCDRSFLLCSTIALLQPSL